MEFDRSNQRINFIVEEIAEKWRSSPKSVLPLCDEVEEYADATASDWLKGYAIFFRGYCHYTLNNLDMAEKSLVSSRPYLLQTEQWERLGKNYNMLGIIADCAFDHSLAIEYFFEGLECCSTYGLHSLTFAISCNLATVYIKLREYPMAISCLNRCEELIGEGHTTKPTEKYAAYMNLSACHTYMNDIEAAEKYINLAELADNEDPISGQKATILFMRAKFAHIRGERELLESYIAEIGQMDLSDVVIYDMFDEFFSYANLLAEIGKSDEFWWIIGQFEKLLDDPSSRRSVVSLKLEYYKNTGDTEAYKQCAVEYYELSKQVEEHRFLAEKHNAEVRLFLREESERREKAEEANVILKEKSELDALTGISNRYKLNEVSDKAFTRSFKSHCFAIEILDIDHYKEFNDNYGHQAGDDCLVLIAKQLREMERYERVYVGRYGGDEFMIVYEGYNKDEVAKMAQEISDRIATLDIRHEYSPIAPRVTVSQGIFCKIPSGANKTWDFMYGADLALYHAKRKGKNGYHIITTRAEMTKLETQLPNKKN